MVDGIAVVVVAEVAVDTLDHTGAAVAEQASDHEGIDAGLLEPAGVGATQVVGGHALKRSAK